MTDIRDLILNDDEENTEKVAEENKKFSDANEHVKIAEQLEALSEEDTIVDDLLKTAIVNELAEFIKQNKTEVEDVSNEGADETSS